jgi:hypothetical protein|tara:strand:- start:810 stop:1682 length:873 start_codon:yes stop_codon:yes gene_type:complete
MHANTDNTIGRFRAAMASAEGYARPSRYAIRLFPPSNLRKLVEQQNATTTRGGTNFDAEMYNDTLSQVEAYTARGIQNLNQTIGRQVNIHCDTVTMPGRDLLQQEVQYGSDVKRQMVQTHTYEGNISATFYADKYMRERQFFEMWQNLCVDPISHTANYYDSYVGKMHIYQLGSDTEVNRDMPTYAIEALDVYPATIGAVEYGYAKGNEVQKITVEFAYKSWRNMGTETTGIDFGHAMQTAANVKARTPGILDRLPPDLRRAGKDIFQQGRTVWNPIGRIFKGKVFPPFT